MSILHHCPQLDLSYQSPLWAHCHSSVTWQKRRLSNLPHLPDPGRLEVVHVRCVPSSPQASWVSFLQGHSQTLPNIRKTSEHHRDLSDFFGTSFIRLTVAITQIFLLPQRKLQSDSVTVFDLPQHSQLLLFLISEVAISSEMLIIQSGPFIGQLRRDL